MFYGTYLFKALLIVSGIFLFINFYTSSDPYSIFAFTKQEAVIIRIRKDAPTDERHYLPKENKYKIGIINVLEPNSAYMYKRAMETVRCYASIHNYTNLVLQSEHFRDRCNYTDKFFRRHCITALFLQQYDYLLFIDGDIGVANPVRKIEEYIDPDSDVTFFDRFINQEIMAGSMLLKNSTWTMEFLKDYAEFEKQLPSSFHGSDNGALHLFVAKKLFSNRPEEYESCIKVYNKTKNYPDLFVYESCIRALLGAWEKFPHVRILRKGTGWARDARTTNSLWDPEKDFMFHEWKQRALIKYRLQDLPIRPTFRDPNQDWYDPTIGEFDYDKCVPGNTTWNHDRNLIYNSTLLQQALVDLREKLRKNYYSNLGKILSF